jgi:hypothetical protein
MRRQRQVEDVVRTEKEAATTIQRGMRMLVERKRDWEEQSLKDVSATRVQAHVRRYQVRGSRFCTVAKWSGG